MRKRTRAEVAAIQRQRQGKAQHAAALEMQAPIDVGGSAPRVGHVYVLQRPERRREALEQGPRPGAGGGKSNVAARMQGANDPRYGSYRWKQLRARLIAERKQCEGECKGFWPAKYADHVIEVRDDTSDDNFFDESNIQVLCAQCHGRKTAAERARRQGRKYTPRQMRTVVDPATGLPLPGQAHWWSED
jgi:5-methylcytosine-specific restriction endonuclease McrA